MSRGRSNLCGVSGEGEGGVFNLAMQVIWMFSGMKYSIIVILL